MHATSDHPFCEILQHVVAPVARVHMGPILSLRCSVWVSPSTLKVKPVGAGTASQAPPSAWGGTSYRAAAVISFSINKHNTRRRSWNADKNTEWMWVRTVMNKQRFKRQDTCLDVSLLSDACLGGTWVHQRSNTDLVTRRAPGSPLAPFSMVHKDKQVWPHPM